MNGSVDALLNGTRTASAEGRTDDELELGSVSDIVVLMCVPI